MLLNWKILAMVLVAAAELAGGSLEAAQAIDRVTFKEPGRRSYEIAQPAGVKAGGVGQNDWLLGWPENHPRYSMFFGNRVVLQLQPGESLAEVLDQTALKVSRVVRENLVILQATSASVAINEASRLAALPQVSACYPIRRRQAAKLGAYATKPNDPYFKYQWYLEHRGEEGELMGPDLNVRAAWPYAQGKGVIVAVVDDGIDLTHPDLALRGEGAPHFNFDTGLATGLPLYNDANHGTAVAGLVAAETYDGLGMTGTAYEAQLASWVIWDQDGFLVSDEILAGMFEYQSEVVAIQNHSWGNASDFQFEPTLLERLAISNAAVHGRAGKGVVIVRAGGNWRENMGDANDDGYANSPSVIAVGAVRTDGRAASYSNPGACLLVAGPSGDIDQDFPAIFTTDRVGDLGYNRMSFTNDFANYAFDDLGFSGTSAAAPLISGVAALLLSANTNLSVRDLQWLLALSARHFDRQDPDLTTNSAGFVVSHNDGFGVPDAGVGVRLAKTWPSRPAVLTFTYSNDQPKDIPDDGLRVRVTAPGAPEGLTQMRCLPSLGPHPDAPMPSLPLIDVGLATNTIPIRLEGHGALIQRGITNFSDKIQLAANAGAAFAIVYNNRDGDSLVRMAETEYSPIPAVFIGENDGLALRDYLQSRSNAPVQIALASATYKFAVTNTLLCEHVGVRLTADHPRRGDLRITLTSPRGTRSVLQHINYDEIGGPVDWTYVSTHHFGESSFGTWTVAISDEELDNAGRVEFVHLILRGTVLVDSDHDGLDDRWEQAHFQNLAAGPQDDPDEDGYSNMRESLMGTDPRVDERNLELNLSVWNPRLVRLSWPSTPTQQYEVWTTSQALTGWHQLTTLAGEFPETIWFAPYTNGLQEFFQIKRAN